jgi:lysozyme family protein
MQENFRRSLEFVLQYEGGFVNHPFDKGGPTNLGITLQTLKEYYKLYNYGDFNNDGEIDINDIILLNSIDKVEPIYKNFYWDKMKLDNFPSGIDFLMFDFGVNSGPKNATKILQRSLNRIQTIEVDGILGSQTLKRVNKTPVDILVENMLQERNLFYRKIVSNDPTQQVFLKGWINRLNNVSERVGEFT